MGSETMDYWGISMDRSIPQFLADPTSSRGTMVSRAGNMKAIASILVALFLVSCAGGCVQPAYHFGAKRPPVDRLVADEPMVERGKPRKVIDAIGWTLGIPGKIILWDRRVDNHNVSQLTEDVTERYLVENEMPDVKVRINQYAPGGEWRRLWKNDKVGLGWRATFGLVSWVGYTILPGRIIGGDAYNPYTHSIYLYSDVPAIGLHEGGHAKDFASRRWPGTYAALGQLPFASWYVEAVATRDALGYLAAEGRREELADAVRILYPAYGTYIGGELGSWVFTDYSFIAPAVGAIPGHIVGYCAARKIRKSLPPTVQGPYSPPLKHYDTYEEAVKDQPVELPAPPAAEPMTTEVN